MKNILNIILLSLVVVLATEAQQLPVLNHYLYNPYLYNPARTGDNGVGAINLNFKRQWTSMPDAPITGALSVEAPVPGTDMGVGALLYSDRTHIINRVGGMGTYAYHIPFSRDFKHQLSAGMSLGIIHQSFDFPSATVEDPNDPQIFSNMSRATSFDFSAGLNYSWKDLNIGASLMQGLNNQMRYLDDLGEEMNFVNSRHFIFTGSYDFFLGATKDFMIRPVAMGRIVPGLPVQAEGNLLLAWKQTLWLGMGYRSSNNETSTSAITASLGVELKKRIFFAYSFEIGADATLNNALGSQHEFMLSYRFVKDDAKDKELEKMKEELSKLNRKDSLQSASIAEMTNNIDSLGANNKSLENRVNVLENNNTEIVEKMNSQEQIIREQQKAIITNREEIEKLRALIKNQPFKYKKMGSVNFDLAASTLKATEKAKLDALKATLEENTASTIYLYGNASTDGDADKNLELSAKRCISVRKYLISLGVAAERVILLPMGQENTTTGGSSVNEADRRVDIMLAND